MNAVLYARVSTEKQADKDLSIPAQLQAMREYAARKGWTISEEFVEPGVSGRSAKRPVLQAMLKRCRERPTVDVILVHKLDRLCRSVYDHAIIRFQLREQSVTLASVVENVDDSISGQLLENIMASIAEFYSANLGEESKKGMRQKIEQGGWPHLPPRGYQVVRDSTGRGHIEVDDDDAPAIRDAFEQYATGFYSLHHMRYRLADNGFTASTGKPVPLEGVRRLLMNPFYAGRVRWHGVEYAGKHAPMVSEDLFLRVQQTLNQRHRDTGEKGRLHFLMRGVAVCAECGSKLTAERHGRWSYYRCVKNVSDCRLCTAAYSNVERAHENLLRLYKRLKVSPELRERIEREGQAMIANRAATRKERLKSLRMRQVKLEAREVKLSETYASGEMSLKAYRSGLASLRSQLVAVENAIAEVDADPKVLVDRLHKVLEFAESLYDLHQTLDEQRRARMLRVVFKCLILDRGEVVGYTFHVPFDRLLSEGGSSGGGVSRRHLEDPQVTPTISSIFEFDLDRLPVLGETAA